MTGYFIFRLILDVLLAAALIAVLLAASRKFQKRKVSRGYLIFVPTIVSAILLVHIVFMLAPKLLDTARAVGRSGSFARIVVSEEGIRPGRMEDEQGTAYYYNPFRLSPRAGEQYNINYLPASGFITQAVRQDNAAED